MKKKYLVLTIFLFLLRFTFAENPFIKNYTIEDGLPTNKIIYVYQDSKSFIWFATDAGVIRFDGHNFVNFKQSEGLSDDVVVRIKEDLQGRVWFLNLNGTSNFFQNGKIYNETNAPFLKNLKTNFYLIDFYEDADSTLYFYNTASEVFEVKNNEIVDYFDFGFGNPSDVGLLFFGKSLKNEFLLWTAQGIYSLKSLNDIPRLTYCSPESLVKCFSINKNRNLVLDRTGVLSIFNDNKPERKVFNQVETLYINSAAVDGDNNIWLASYDQGVFCINENKIVLHLDIKQIQGFIVDNEKNIWITSSSEGIYKINPELNKFNFIDNSEFENLGVRDLEPSHNGGLWLTNGRSIQMIYNNKLVDKKIELNGSVLNNIYELKNNTIITNSNGTEVYAIEKVKYNPVLNTLEYKTPIKLAFVLKNIAVSNSEKFIYSSLNNSISIVNLEKNYYFSTYPQRSTGRINNIFFNRKNQLVINATRNFVFLNDTLRNSTELAKYNGQKITSRLTIDKQNEIYNIIGNQLILCNDSGTFDLAEKFRTLIDYRIRNLAYNDSTLFFFTSNSVYFINNPLQIIKGKSPVLNRLNVEFKDINDILIIENILYIASYDGIISIPVKDCVTEEEKRPKPYFYKIFLDDEEYDSDSEEIVFKHRKRLSIEFASLNFSPYPSNYSYKLEGIDQNWISGEGTRVVYLNLSPGHYSFKLKARKGMENYSEEVVLPIVVKPTFFQNRIIQTFIVLFILFVVFVIIWLVYASQIKKKEIESTLITLEHKALQSMMNPHFIFNALGSIQRYLLQNKAEEAGIYLSQFARLIRQNMNSLKTNSICIDDEVERLRNYIELEQFRMNNKFEYTIDVDNEIDGDELGIPSMVVQPFVENAIWHGISPLPENGEINIKFRLNDENSVIVIVEDTGVGIKKESAKPKSENNLNMGVSLTEKRLKLIGEKYGVHAKVISEELLPGENFPGTKITLIVPLIP